MAKMTKLAQLVITYLVLPLAEKALKAAIKYFKDEWKITKAAKKAEKKVDEYKKKKSTKDSDSDFNSLP